MESDFQIGDIVDSQFGPAVVVNRRGDEAAIRLLPQVGEVYIHEGRIVGRVVEVDVRGSVTIEGEEFAAAVASGNVKNPQLEARRAKAAAVLGAGARLQLAALGL